MKLRNRLTAAGSVAMAIVAMLLLSGTPAQALTILPNSVGITGADIGQSFDVNWLVASTNPDLTATSTWTVEDFSSSALTLKISMTNTTPNSLASSITAFGLGISPDATGAFATNGEGDVFKFIGAGSGPNETFPGGFKAIDICIGPSSPCAGDAFNDGLLNGITDTITIVLSGLFGDNPAATLAFFPLKFQTALGSFEPAGAVVPLPASLPLLGAALAGLGLLGRRSRLRAAPTRTALA